MKNSKQLIRFDWAMKKLLRDKANFDVLEGFLSVLLNEKSTIKQILESEGNKEEEDDKFNRVDILVENEQGELIIIEVQNTKEYDYFHRMLYGTSKAITERIKENDPYAIIKKIISITIAYFDLGHGKDYVYHGENKFIGIHEGDILQLSERQSALYNKTNPSEIFPEYWLIKVGKFVDELVKDKLDEWIYFLKNGEIKEDFTAQGLEAAKDKLDKMKMSEEDRKDYNNYVKNLHNIASSQHTKMADAEELIDKGVQQGKVEVAKEMKRKGFENALISELTGLATEEIESL
jgi:predicted transposase/invertase (TIGR01784 family)